MPLTTAEGVNDALAGLGIGEEIIAIVQTLPPKETRKFADYKPIVDLIGAKVLPLVDQVEADIKS